MTAVEQSLLEDLRRRGVKLRAEKDRLVVDAPQGALSTVDREALRACKQPLLKRLRVASRVLDLSLDEFEQQDHAIELAVPWLDETLWFVPRAEHVWRVIESPTDRGRVFTAGELRNLWGLIDDDPHAAARGIAHLKHAFGAILLSATDPSEDGEAS